MFEIGIFGVILLAIGYWATLFVIGRRRDVLHGQFVEADDTSEPAAAPASPVPTRPRATGLAAPAASESAPAPAPASTPTAPAKTSVTPDSLQLLLTSLKQELKNAAQI